MTKKIIYPLLFVLFGCINSNNIDRKFFINMPEFYNVPEFIDSCAVNHLKFNIKKDIDEFKGFGLSKKSKEINNNLYYAINNENAMDNNIRLNGFLREEDGKILIYTYKEQLFLDYNAKKGDVWKIHYSEDLCKSDEIKYFGKMFEQNINDTIYALMVLKNNCKNDELISSHSGTVSNFIFISKKYGIIGAEIDYNLLQVQVAFYPDVKIKCSSEGEIWNLQKFN